ncbi:hypothetical protein CANMA_002955 [Candida margitis]|uniref:uncharacterized protein n=1 Tax=Candida margitis TaxID=1775924 RepID=UPI0022269DB3|nr:uncharacterized protein CANMA_002955 [Candida margitis]KAI5967521.1 hypothetical protein CANMA_002955 [Candida margitis]
MLLRSSTRQSIVSRSPNNTMLTLYLILFVLPTIIVAAAGPATNFINKDISNNNLDEIVHHNSTSSPPVFLNNNNNKTFALIQGTKLERESTSSGWQINAGIYLEKSIGDGHSTMWESSSDDSSDDDENGWGWAKGARRSKKKKFSMLSHDQAADARNVIVNEFVNGSYGTIRLYRDDGADSGGGIVVINTTGSDLWMENDDESLDELRRERSKFKSKKQHSWSEIGDDGDGDNEGDDSLKSDANHAWNKIYFLVKLYLLIIWIVVAG